MTAKVVEGGPVPVPVRGPVPLNALPKQVAPIVRPPKPLPDMAMFLTPKSDVTAKECGLRPAIFTDLQVRYFALRDHARGKRRFLGKKALTTIGNFLVRQQKAMGVVLGSKAELAERHVKRLLRIALARVSAA